MLDEAQAIIKSSLAAIEAFGQTGPGSVVRAAEALAAAFTAGRKVLLFGNGGSAADAQHLAAEFINRFMMERPSLPAVALTTDCSAITAIANDYEFAEIFAKQIKGLGRKGDVALGMSTSGHSPNVLKGLATARRREMITIGLCGQDTGDMAPLCDHLISVPSADTPRVQEVHCLALHMLGQLVDRMLFGGPP